MEEDVSRQAAAGSACQPQPVGYCLTKPSDTVGQPQSAVTGASHRPLWKAPEHGVSEAETAVVSHRDRMTNSIGWFFKTPGSLALVFLHSYRKAHKKMCPPCG